MAFDIRRIELDKLNSLTKYPSILTYHKLGDKGVLQEAWTSGLAGPAASPGCGGRATSGPCVVARARNESASLLSCVVGRTVAGFPAPSGPRHHFLQQRVGGWADAVSATTVLYRA